MTGDRYADALAASEHALTESGAMAVHAYDQLETLLGQATVALELSQQAPALDTLLVADSLAPRSVGELMFPIAQIYVERVVLVEDSVIREAQQRLWETLRIVAEPGGVAALSAVLSGANTTAVDFTR